MLSKRALKELLETTKSYPGGFVVLEDNQAKFVILDYETYERLTEKKPFDKPQPQKILVTGGAGYVGSHTARLLQQNGYEIVTIDNLSTGTQEFAQGKFVKGDLCDEELLDKIFTENNFEAVMHFAASIDLSESVGDPLAYWRNNVTTGITLLEVMARHGIYTLVFSSTCAVYADDAPVPMTESASIDPSSPYGDTKVAFEKILASSAFAHGINSVSLRYFNPAGASFDGLLGQANPETTHLIPNALNVALGKKEELIINGNDYNTQDGTAVRDYIHILDVAEAHVLALDFLAKQKKPIAEFFNIGTGRGYSVLEVIDQVCESTGKMIKFQYGPRRPGDREQVFADTTKARIVLGFTPKYSDLKTIIDTHWAFHKKRFGN